MMMFEELKDTSVLITGATGLIGSRLVLFLDRLNREENRGIRVYACCRSEEKFRSCFSGCDLNNIVPVYGDICTLDIKNCAADHIIHAASTTSSISFVKKPVETIKTAVQGTINLLDQCIGKKLKGFVYLSSLEVYGKFDDAEVRNVVETDYGLTDPLSIRSSYSEGKRLCECMCCSYAAEYGIPVKIARLAQTFGDGVAYDDGRVFAQFARSIIEHENIILKTRGETVRNYCHVSDAVTGIMAVLLSGETGEAYNIANKSTTVSIADMAKLFCQLYPDSGSRVIFDLAEDAARLGYNPVVRLQLDSSKLEALGWHPEKNLEDMIHDLIRSMKKKKNE